ncbi:MAG: tRNA lysidine(34) synthetase TilS [Planctomycetes bacterium]|nr:tRNA lysidine(34) synthetase TilS [Planctomycetota bacterium]
MVEVASSTARRVPLPARRHWLTGEVARRLRDSCGVDGGGLVVGVSGGADSVALLFACVTAAERDGTSMPRAVHVNHHLREGADDDAAFVENLCETHRIPFHARDVYPGLRRGNTAEHARTLRYEALADVARSQRAGAVAVAHHGDDQLETMLIALGRGTGADGLAGMPWRRSIADGVALVRPLLAARATDCAEYCRCAGVTWRDDPGNRDRDRVRARLRQDVIPVLEELWPDAPRRATGAADAVDTARAALTAVLDERFGPPDRRAWARADLAGLPVSVVAAGLRRAALDAAPDRSDDFGRRVLEPAASAILGSAIAPPAAAPKRFDWPGGLRLHVDTRAVRLVAPE